ncbi:MAG: tetratricopeptide repeat protein [Nibricoccus sp.]
MLTPSKFLRTLGLCFTAAALVLGANVLKAEPKPENPPELDEKISNAVQPLQALLDAKKYDEAMHTIDGLIAKTPAVSYDRAFLSLIKTQIYGQKGELSSALVPLEQMLKIADELKLFRFSRALPISEQDTLVNLASLYLQEASAPGKTPEEIHGYYAKARTYGKRLVSGPKKPTVDAQSIWARILYSEATMDPNKVDMTLMKQAAEAAQKALTLVVKPKEEHYTLLLAALQQLGENARCAELLELMVKLFPNNKNYYSMLFGFYVSMQGSDNKDADLSAIVTLERAQAIGQMTANKDNFALAAMYLNIQQFGYAAELFEKGLRSGKIDSDQRNWELLASAYQQQGMDNRAIDTFLEAIKRFPKSPTLEQQVGQLYYNQDKREEAYVHLCAAVKKGLDKPAQTLVTAAYLGMQLGKLEDALALAEQAVKADPKSKNAQQILDAIKETITEREKFKNQK